MSEVHGLFPFDLRFTGWFEVWSAGLRILILLWLQEVDKALKQSSPTLRMVFSVSGSTQEDLCQARQKHALFSA